MKLKFYLRGLGIGIIVTALCLFFSMDKDKGKSMTDEQVIARATELGMVKEDKVLKPKKEEVKAEEPKDEVKEVKAEEPKKEEVKEEVKAEEPKAEDAKEEVKAEEPKAEDAKEEKAEEPKEDTKKEIKEEKVEETKEEPKEEIKEENTKQEETQKEEAKGDEASEKPVKTNGTAGADASISIKPGNSSEDVCALLKNAGVITDEAEFNDFLCKSGYDRRLSVGTHAIKAGMTYEEIAKAMVH